MSDATAEQLALLDIVIASQPAERRGVPPITQVRPGLWSIPVPLGETGMRYVHAYAFETDSGIYLVDVGWNTDEAVAALQSGLGQLGASFADVRGVMITHLHPDHYGMAGRVQQDSGAWVALHPADAELLHDRYEQPDGLLARMNQLLRAFGAPADELEALTNVSMPMRDLVVRVEPDVLLDDGDRPHVPGWQLEAVWTPGHSPGHLCFWEPNHELLLTGDCVLPRITPNIPFHVQAGTDPLGDYLASLDRLDEYDPVEVLPAHEYRYLRHHERLAQLREHHERRFDEVFAAIDGGLTTAWEVAEQMLWTRPWDELLGFTRRSAVAEAAAHLRALARRGLLDEEHPASPDEPYHWRRPRITS